MSRPTRNSSSVQYPEIERSSPASKRHSERGGKKFPRLASEKKRVTLLRTLALLYEVPAQWVRTYMSDADDGAPWTGGDREFLCGPFSTDVHSSDA